jgi:hypothetical protein
LESWDTDKQNAATEAKDTKEGTKQKAESN